MQKSASPSVVKAVLAGGLLAALLDLLDPIVFFGLRNGVAPIRIPQSIASGLMGRAAFSGGLRTALLGVALHIGIALFWATLFVLAAQRLLVLSRHAVPSGLFYGALIYLVMNYIVLPRSHVAPSRFVPVVVANGVFAMLILVGLPISLCNLRFAPKPRVFSN